MRRRRHPLSYKTQSEEVLQPLAEPEPISHEGFGD